MANRKQKATYRIIGPNTPEELEAILRTLLDKLLALHLG